MLEPTRNGVDFSFAMALHAGDPTAVKMEAKKTILQDMSSFRMVVE